MSSLSCILTPNSTHPPVPLEERRQGAETESKS
jgi:hypothetical protein